ncbi:MAG: capsule biosynthesis protein [Bacteroides sp.]|nr:capsule biosynthesis protein [Bacteroides sp.]
MKMNLRSIFSIGILAFALSAWAMTDDEVIRYIRTQTANGKTEQQIGKELMAKGVSAEQVRRIKQKYNSEGSAASGTTVAAQSASLRRNRNSSSSSRNSSTSRNSSARQNDQQGRRNQQDQQGRRNQQDRNNQQDRRNQQGYYDYEDYDGRSTSQNQQGDIDFEEDFYVIDVLEPEEDEIAYEVYGHDLFNSSNLSFEPNQNLATPKDYRLGPGDEVVIDVWGDAEEHIREVISPEGSIMVSRLGPVYLNGKTVNEANSYVKNLFARKYAGVSNAQTDVNLTLGEIRSIQIDIMGEVSTPGSFRMSPFSTVFHALYNAGGINDIGSMRNISVLRNGKRVATVDIYDYLFNGKQTGNIRLQEGDVIIVPPYDQIVNISGNVKRPMHYEIKPGETVASLLEYSGGLSGDAYSGMVRLSRQNGEENELYNIDKGEFASYQLKDGDVVTVGTVLDRYSNRVELKGAVMRPGLYALGQGTTTLASLIRKADGLTEDAYKGRALLYRQGKDLTLEVIPVDLAGVMSGVVADIPLQKNDIIEIVSVQEIHEKGDFTIIGMVTNPGEYSFMENTSVEDLILRAGGLREGASTARVDISRRIVDPTATTENSRIAETFSIDIYGGLNQKRNEAKEFILKPYDRVTVRRSPGYGEQKEVKVFGEVLFPGSYTLQRRNERLSDLVARTGGTVDGAYLKGAYLKRQMTDDENQVRENIIRMAFQNQGSDSVSLNKIEVDKEYVVGINLPEALAHPGSTYDLVLQEGDKLYVPQYQSTVKISGDVLYPNTVVFEPGKKVSYYINQAGGYGNRAKKSKCFIVYMSGQVARVNRKTVVEPGSHIVVPSKDMTPGHGWEKTLSIISGFGSIATMAATVAALFRK